MFYGMIHMLKNTIKIILALSVAAAVMLSFCADAQSEISLFVDGSQISTDVAPIIVNDRTLVPVRCIFEAFDAAVDWVEATRQVIITSGDDTIILAIDNKRAYFNNTIITLDAAPVIVSDRTLVPIRFISEKLGYGVEWNDEEKSVNIYSPKQQEPKMLITEVKAVKNTSSSTVTIKADNFAKPVISTADSPARYILDFPNASVEGGDSRIKFNQNKDISEIRYAGHDGYARVVIESPSEAEYSCEYGDGYMSVTVTANGAVVNPDEDNGDDDNSPIKTEKPLVVIDAGHGGWDTGAIGYSEDGEALLRECDANLTIAQGVQRYLEAEGVSVLMTRTADKALGSTEMADLLARCAVANNAEATLFVSIHNNSFSNPEASGTMVLYADTDNKLNYGVTSKQLAENILEPLADYMQLLNRGVSDSPKMVVLKKTDMPSVLVECGFVSCPQDRAILMDAEKLDGIARAIAGGITDTIACLPKN